MHSRGGNRLALGGVNVIKAQVDRLVHLAGADLLGHLPCAKADGGDLSPVVQVHVLEWHLSTGF